MEQKKFDLIVIGAGPGGYPAAIRAAQKGKNVALIEAKEVGGTCLNRGCIPSKALIAGAEAFQRFKHAKEFGISFEGLGLDYGQLCQHKDQTVDKMRRGLEQLIAANKITIFRGTGRCISPTEVKISGAETSIITADNIIIATGSEPRNLSAFPFDYEKIHDSTSLLNLKKLPKSLIVIGGGVIGCEFASLFASLGVEITILELLPDILSTESKEVIAAISKAFLKKGIKTSTNVKVQSIDKTTSGVVVHCGENVFFEAEMCLVSVGRTLNTSDIGLDKAGVYVCENGMIPVNEHMESNVRGIYAVGDISSKWWLAHVATHQGLIAADNVCGHPAKMDYHAIPSVIFTHPEVGSVGLSLETALQRGYQAKIGAFPYQALGKAQAICETEGFAQVVIDEKTGQILGAQVVGYEASSLISEMTLAITNELTIECVTETIHAHPTLAESWLEASFIAEGWPLHFPPKRKPNQ